MSNYKPIIIITLLLIALMGWGGVACARRAAPRGVPIVSSALSVTQEADQYHRDAQATTQARRIAADHATATFAADLHNIAATAQAEKATAVAQQVQATATAYMQATQDSLMVAMTIDSATAQAAAAATAQTERAAHITATAAAEQTQQAFVATRQALDVTREATMLAAEAARLKREQTLTIGLYSFLFIGGVLLLGVLLWFFYKLSGTLINRASLIRYGQHGNPLLLSDKNGRTIITNPLTMMQPVTQIDPSGNATMPELTPNELQVAATGGMLRLLLEQTQHAPGHIPQLPTTTERTRQFGRYQSHTTTQYAPAVQAATMRPAPPPAHAPTHTTPRLVEPPPRPLMLPAEAPLTLLEQWQHGLALGVGAGGHPIRADQHTLESETAHFLIAATTGAGKTRNGIWPLITSALLDGTFKVLIFDRTGVDFWLFDGHPNAVVMPLAQPEAAVAHMEQLYAEAVRRMGILREQRVSTWGRLLAQSAAGQFEPRMLAVFDEFNNLADLMDDKAAKALWRYARMISAEGRKAGIHLVLALQDPTHRGIDLRIRRNCTPIAYRLNDATASRVILNEAGAEGLHRGQFLTRTGHELVKGVAFAPNEAQITTMLQSRPVLELPSPQHLLRLGDSHSTHPIMHPQPDPNTVRIRELLTEGLSMRAIQRDVFGYVGGAAYEAVKAVVDENQGDVLRGEG